MLQARGPLGNGRQLAPVAPSIRGMNGIDLTGIITRNWGISVIVMTG
jgi:hypothetical protein